MDLSIITVNYKVRKEIINCIRSIISSMGKINYEIIVVDNEGDKSLKDELKKYRNVIYVLSKRNLGFGGGNNLGNKVATGKYLLFLNPDTIVDKKAINNLLNFCKSHPDSGMVAPLLLDMSGKVYSRQGSNEYSFINSIVTSSMINKLFPNNPISRKFYHSSWDRKKAEEFDVVPGTAFMISKDLFEKAGLFDEKIFLYFEEYDLAKRLKKMGHKNYILPIAKVRHIWEASTKKNKDIKKIISDSRFYFFKKHYGFLFASIVNIFANIGKFELMLVPVLALSAFLGLYRIKELMVFIGDQGWFYLSARDMLVNGQIPLLGIASSHPWLHQGPLWTYLLALSLWIYHFDPLGGAYLTISLGILSVAGIYLLGSALFSRRVGIIAALLYTVSPLVVYYTRLPYHTSPIPFFVIILIYILFKIIQGKLNYFPLSILILAILYNFEIATVSLLGVLICLLVYRWFKEKNDFKQILNKKNIFYSVLALITPLLPMIIYDVRNGFPQTVKFAAWTVYRVASLFNHNSQQAFSINKVLIMFTFLFNNFTKLIFPLSVFVSAIILVCLVVWAFYLLVKYRQDNSINLILLLIFVPFIFVILNQVPSDAYLPIFFPSVILFVSILIEFAMSKKYFYIPALLCLALIVTVNICFLLKNDFSFDVSNRFFTLEKRYQAAHLILNIAQKRDYNLKGLGSGSEFKSFTMNYAYLTWQLGHGPATQNKNLKILILESKKGINVENLTK